MQLVKVGPLIVTFFISVGADFYNSTVFLGGAHGKLRVFVAIGTFWPHQQSMGCDLKTPGEPTKNKTDTFHEILVGEKKGILMSWLYEIIPT